MVSKTNASFQVEQINYRRLGLASLAAALLAATANSTIFLIAEATGAITRDFVIPTSNQPFSVGLVASLSFAGVLIGSGILAGLGRFTRRPITIFRIVALGFLVLYAAAPLALSAPLSLVLTLELMHLVAGAIAIGMLTRLAQRK